MKDEKNSVIEMYLKYQEKQIQELTRKNSILLARCEILEKENKKIKDVLSEHNASVLKSKNAVVGFVHKKKIVNTR